MRKLLLFIFTLVSSFVVQAQCVNGDLESNNFSGWTTWVGSNSGGTLNLSTFTASTHPTRHLIVTSGNDPLIGTALPRVRDGSYSLRLGHPTATAADAQIASYTFTVSSDFSFLYALVLQDPTSASEPHTEAQRPFFSYWISKSNNLVNSTSSSNLIVQKKFIANTANPFFSSVPYGGLPLNYKDWQTECVPALSSYIGETVTIYFATANCSIGGHFGYAYIDGLCKPNNPVPSITAPTTVCNIEDSLVVSGSSTWNEVDYYWKISRSYDATGTIIYGGTTVTTPVVLNSPVGTLNVKGTYGAGGMTMVDGGFYRITLFVRNCNGLWVSTSKIVKIQYPNLITSANTIICCGSSTVLTAQIGGTTSGGSNYPASAFKWYDESGTFIGNGTMSGVVVEIGGSSYWKNKINVTPNKSTKYRVVFESSGCKNEKWVYVTTYYALNRAIPSEYNFSLDDCTFPRYVKKNTSYWLNCNGTNEGVSDLSYHDAMARSSISYLWSTGATTQEITGNANTDYWVRVTTPCGVDTFKFKLVKFTGPIPDLAIPTAIIPGTTTWFVKDPSLPILTRPAFNANKFDLKIFDRWGVLVYESSGRTDIDGFLNNFAIRWDGYYTGGSPAALGVYNYILNLYNCTNARTFTGDITVVY